MEVQALRLDACCATLARSHAARERIYRRAAGRAIFVSGGPCPIDNLVSDLHAASPGLPRGDASWMGEAAQHELRAFVERFLAVEVADDVAYLVEERVRDAWGKMADSLRSLREPTPANVRARLHHLCRREQGNELKHRRVRLRETRPASGANPLDGVAARGRDGSIAAVDGAHSRGLLLRAVSQASQEIPVQYNVWRMSLAGLTQAEIGEQLGFTDRAARNHLTSFQAFIVSDLLSRGLAEDDLVEIGIRRKDLPRLKRKGRKFQRQKKQRRSRRNEQQ